MSYSEKEKLEIIETIKQMKSEGKSYREISEFFGLAESTLRGWIKPKNKKKKAVVLQPKGKFTRLQLINLVTEFDNYLPLEFFVWADLQNIDMDKEEISINEFMHEVKQIRQDGKTYYNSFVASHE